MNETLTDTDKELEAQLKEEIPCDKIPCESSATWRIVLFCKTCDRFYCFSCEKHLNEIKIDIGVMTGLYHLPCRTLTRPAKILDVRPL